MHIDSNMPISSNDHKPDNEEETRRIYAADGWVEFNRVNGDYSVSQLPRCLC